MGSFQIGTVRTVGTVLVYKYRTIFDDTYTQFCWWCIWQWNCQTLCLGNSAKEISKMFGAVATFTSSVRNSLFTNIIVPLLIFFHFYIGLMVDMQWKQIISYIPAFPDYHEIWTYFPTFITQRTATFWICVSLPIFQLCCLFLSNCNSSIHLLDIVFFFFGSLFNAFCVCMGMCCDKEDVLILT